MSHRDVDDSRPDGLDDVLSAVAAGTMSPTSARERLARYGIACVGDYARLDLGRNTRTGIPEVVYAAAKTQDELVSIVSAFVRRTGVAFCSSATPEQARLVEAAELGDTRYDDRSGVLVVHGPGYRPPDCRGAIGVFAAGTGDVARAEEAAAIAREMGVSVVTAYDVGVAGLHRLKEPLSAMSSAEAGAVVVAAGMEGALPSVVAGLVDVPVVGLPTSVGYGFGGGGEAALMGMLQSCVPGLVVVNIDNGIGAGATAGLIARRAAS